jgi:hypothetical protein
MLGPHLSEPPARKRIQSVVGEERSTLMRHLTAF